MQYLYVFLCYIFAHFHLFLHYVQTLSVMFDLRPFMKFMKHSCTICKVESHWSGSFMHISNERSPGHGSHGLC